MTQFWNVWLSQSIFFTLFKVPSWCKESWGIGKGHFTFCFIVPPILFIGYKTLHWKLQTSSEERIFKSRYPSLLVSYFFSILFFLINIEMIDRLQKVRKFLNSFSHIPFKSKSNSNSYSEWGKALLRRNLLPFISSQIWISFPLPPTSRSLWLRKYSLKMAFQFLLCIP